MNGQNFLLSIFFINLKYDLNMKKDIILDLFIKI